MRALSVFIASVLLSQLLACRVNNRLNDGPVFVCVQLPDQYYLAGSRATDQWDTAVKAWTRIYSVQGAYEECKIFVKPAITPSTNPDALAWAETLSGLIYMVQGKYETAVEPLLLHELGHQFGLIEHAEGTLMAPKYDPNSYGCIDTTTLWRLSEVAEIPLELLKTTCAP